MESLQIYATGQSKMMNENDNSQDPVNEFGLTFCQNYPQEKLFHFFAV